MAFQDDFYIISSTSYIKSVPTKLDMEFNFADKKLILEALEAYKDTDNDEYNIEINDLINKIQNN